MYVGGYVTMCESHNIIKVNMCVVSGGRFKKVFIDTLS